MVKLGEVVDETTNFDRLIGPASGNLIINCSAVRRINSAGIRVWTSYFNKLRKGGVHLHFQECTPIIVQSISLIKEFLAGGSIDSLYVPFTCMQCSQETQKLFTVKELRASRYEITPVKCAHCGGSAEFDEVPSEYFAFLAGT